jgi:heme exporter protein A
MLTLENISFNYLENNIFTNISLSIVSGSVFLIKGPNGSGKTTLLKIIAGIIKPSQGVIKWNDVNIYDDIGLYHQYCASYLGIENAIKKDLTVIDNLSFWAELKDNKELIAMAMSHFKLSEIAEIKCSKLSSGNLKKVALVRMIIANTGLWLMDEPDSFLDSNAKDYLQKLIQVKVREGGIVILTSHNFIEKMPQCAVLEIENFKNIR